MTITFLDPENKYIKEYPKDVHKGYFFANDRFNNQIVRIESDGY